MLLTLYLSFHLNSWKIIVRWQFYQIFFKMVLLTLYLSFHLKSGKKIFRCRFYQKFFVFWFFLQKKILKNQGCILEQFFYHKFVANKISFPTVCITFRFIAVFGQFKSIKVEIFLFFTHFFTLATILVWKRSYWPMLF